VDAKRLQLDANTRGSPTSLAYFYYSNSGGGPPRLPPKPDNDWKSVIRSVGTLALTVAFFLSPVGGFVLALFNSFLVLALVVPLTGFVAFNAWQAWNTIQAPCPSCATPIRILKSPEQPQVCLQCGRAVQATADGKGIETAFVEEPSLFDALFGDEMLPSPQRASPRRRGSDTVIDVEVVE